MSKKDQKIVINNSIDNSNTNVKNSSSEKSGSSLQKWAAWATIISTLVALYLFFQKDVHGWFESDYDSKVEHRPD